MPSLPRRSQAVGGVTTLKPGPRKEAALGVAHLGLLLCATIAYGMVSGALFGGRPDTQIELHLALMGQQILVMGGLTWLLVHQTGHPVIEVIGQTAKPLSWAAVVIVGTPAFIIVAVAPMMEGWEQATGLGELSWYELGLSIDDWQSGLLVLVSVAIVPPICEEWVFRGYLMWRFRRLSVATAIILQAVVFAAYHVDLYGLPAYLVSGLMLGTVRVLSGAIWPAILLHAINNALGIYDYNVGGTAWTSPTATVWAISAIVFVLAATLGWRQATPDKKV